MLRRFFDICAKNRLRRMRILGTIDAEQFCAVPTAVGKREFPGSDRSVACDPRASSDGSLAGAMVRSSAARSADQTVGRRPLRAVSALLVLPHLVDFRLASSQTRSTYI